MSANGLYRSAFYIGEKIFSSALWDDSDKKFCRVLDSPMVRKDIMKSAAS